MTEIEVKASTSYKVRIGAGLLPETGRTLAGVVSPCRAMLVSDDRVFPLYGKLVRASLEEAGFAVSEFVFPNGETSKISPPSGHSLRRSARRG